MDETINEDYVLAGSVVNIQEYNKDTSGKYMKGEATRFCRAIFDNTVISDQELVIHSIDKIEKSIK